MFNEDHDWNVNLIKDRYAYLNLSFEQGEKIYLYEQEEQQTFLSFENNFTDWEKLDHERTVFTSFLDEQQLALYNEHTAQYFGDIVRSIEESDLSRQEEINRKEAEITFLRETFLPDLQQKSLVLSSLLKPYAAKINYLKATYQQYLRETKKKKLMGHFRYNRSYAPLGFRILLLEHEIDCLWPNYRFFVSEMDAGTRAITLEVEDKPCSYAAEIALPLLLEKNTLWKEFRSMQHAPQQPIKGWHTIIKEDNPEEAKKHLLMSYLLLDVALYTSLP